MMHYQTGKTEKALLRGLCVLAAVFGLLFSLTAPAAYAQQNGQEQINQNPGTQAPPEETVPEETAPEETAPEETVPEETRSETLLRITFCYPDRTETVSVEPGSSFAQMYPGIDPVTVVAQKEHHVFLGWYPSGDGGQTLEAEAFDFRSPVSGDLELYPMFRPATYTVTFSLDGEVLETVSVDHGGDVTLPQIPPREGFTGLWDHDGRHITADTVISLTYVREGSGRFLLAEGEDNFGGGRLSVSEEALAGAIPLTPQEQQLMESGTDVTVRLSLNSLAEGSAPADRALVEGVLGEMTLCMYLEAELYKQVGREPETQLDRLNSAVTVSFVLPEALLPEDGAVRAFSVIRVHNGVAEAVDAVYSRETGVLSFVSDRFSTFAVVWLDTAAAPPAFTPATGDGFLPGLWLTVWLGCGLALAVLLPRKKKFM